MWSGGELFTLGGGGQVSKFPSRFWIRWNAANIDRGPWVQQVPSADVCVGVCDVCLNHEAFAAAAPGAPAPPTGTMFSGVRDRRRRHGEQNRTHGSFYLWRFLGILPFRWVFRDFSSHDSCRRCLTWIILGFRFLTFRLKQCCNQITCDWIT